MWLTAEAQIDDTPANNDGDNNNNSVIQFVLCIYKLGTKTTLNNYALRIDI